MLRVIKFLLIQLTAIIFYKFAYTILNFDTQKVISKIYVMLRIIKLLLIQLTATLFNKIAFISLNFYKQMVFPNKYK